MKVLAEHAGTAQGTTVALAAASLAIILFWPKRWQRRVPGSIVALILGTAAVAFGPFAPSVLDSLKPKS